MVLADSLCRGWSDPCGPVEWYAGLLVAFDQGPVDLGVGEAIGVWISSLAYQRQRALNS